MSAPAGSEPLPSRRADVRFLLPQVPHRVAVAGPASGWREGLERAGVPLVDVCEPHDTLIVTAKAVRGWRPSGTATQVLVEGRVPCPLGWAASSWLLAVRRGEPIACARLGDGALVREAVRRWVPSTSIKRAAQTGFTLLAGHGLPVPLPRLTVLSRGASAEPGLLGLAEELGAPPGERPLFVLGGGPLTRRVAVMLYPVGSSDPSHVLKTHRLPVETTHRPAEEQALLQRILSSGCTSVRVPAVLDTGLWNNMPATLEEAMLGEAFALLLREDNKRAFHVLTVVARWLGDLAAATTRPAGAGAWQARAEWLTKPWPESGSLARSAADRLEAAAVPFVLEHGDIANGVNVLAGEPPSVIDWVSGSSSGTPLADVLPFFAHGLAVLEGHREVPDVAAAVVRLCKGQSPASAQLAELVHSYLRRLNLPADAAGPLALLTWLRHGGDYLRHLEQLSLNGLPTEASDSVARLVAQQWLTDPDLGLEWSALARC